MPGPAWLTSWWGAGTTALQPLSAASPLRRRRMWPLVRASLVFAGIWRCSIFGYLSAYVVSAFASLSQDKAHVVVQKKSSRVTLTCGFLVLNPIISAASYECVMCLLSLLLVSGFDVVCCVFSYLPASGMPDTLTATFVSCLFFLFLFLRRRNK